MSVAAMLMSAAMAGGGGPTNPNAYTYYRTITIDHTKCGTADSTNYVYMFSGTYSWMATQANGGRLQSASGFDFGFYSDTNLSTLMDFEVEEHDLTTGACVIHVRVPTLAHASDTVIYIAYDSASVTTDQSNAHGAWDANYQIVHHYGSPSSLSLADSTSNARNGTGINTPGATTGIAYGALNATGTKYEQTTYTANGLTAISVEIWYKPTSNVGQTGFLEWASTAAADSSPGLLMQNNAGTMQLYVNGGYRETSTTFTTGTWYHVVMTFGSSLWSFYRNGTLLSTFSGTGFTNSTVSVGTGYNGATTGVMDELRISSATRSASAILAEYNNISSPSTFYTVGAETPA